MIAAPGVPVLTGAKAVFILVSLEGPDAYARVGGLAARATDLAATLGSLGYETHHVFAGDPDRPGEERTMGGRLTLHRWGQWISRFHPGGPYDGEATRVADLVVSLPPYLVDRIIEPAVTAGKVAVVLSEEWQTAECACAIADACRAAGIDDRAAMFWNASAVHGFDTIDWPRLARSATITAPSRHMQGVLRERGVDALVIPAGIPDRMLGSGGRAASRLRAEFDGAGLLVTTIQHDRDTEWMPALDVVGLMRDRRVPATLVVRSAAPADAGDHRLLDAARARGLFAVDLAGASDPSARLATVARRQPHVVRLGFVVDDDLTRVLYAAADAVLVNAMSEPLGVNALEAMAAGGIVFTGGTGEDYGISARNAVLLETGAPDEVVRRLAELGASPPTAARIRRAARATASRFVWSAVARTLIDRAEDRAPSAEHLARHSRLGAAARAASTTPVFTNRNSP